MHKNNDRMKVIKMHGRETGDLCTRFYFTCSFPGALLFPPSPSLSRARGLVAQPRSRHVREKLSLVPASFFFSSSSFFPVSAARARFFQSNRWNGSARAQQQLQPHQEQQQQRARGVMMAYFRPNVGGFIFWSRARAKEKESFDFDTPSRAC